MAFLYQGELSGSKSIINRLLVLQSFDPSIRWTGDSACDDVQKMREAIQGIGKQTVFDCGHAGTVLRFLAFRLSREPGFFHLKGSPALFARPQAEIVYILEQLGPKVQLIENGILIESEGWKEPILPIRVTRSHSSQFLSGLVLSSWNLPFHLHIESGDGVSSLYFQLTKKLVEEFGLLIDRQRLTFTIAAQQKLLTTPYRVEMDMSSWVYLAAASALDGDIQVGPSFTTSNQPDFAGIGYIEQFGIPVTRMGERLRTRVTPNLNAVRLDLNENPDLFPALVILACFAEGTSHFSSVAHLQYKESNRAFKVLELLQLAGVRYEESAFELKIFGRNSFRPNTFQFNPENDHRMAMAASLLQLREPRIQILDEDVVQKSFPDYWKIIRNNA